MALTESTIEDRIEVVGEHKHVQIRTARVIYDDGEEVTRTFSRRVLHCCTKSGDTWSDTDISGESAEVRAVCNAVWKAAVKTAYKNAMDAMPAQIVHA